MRRPAPTSPLVLFLALLAAGPAAAQSPDARLAGLVVRLARLTAVTGYEQRMVDTLATLLPGARRDRAGNLVRGAAGGDRRMLAVCPLDEPGHVVGGIRPDGFLTLRRSPGAVPPGGDARLEGARVAVHGTRGIMPGVIAVRSIHLTRGREPQGDAPFTADSAYLDLGAASAAEVARLGIGVLSVVALEKRPHRYGADLLAAPALGRRAACAALLDAALAVGDARTVVAFAVEQRLRGRGLSTLAHAAGPFAETLLVDGAAEPASSAESVPALGRVTRLAVPVRYAGSPVETVSLADVARVRQELVTRLEAAR